MVDAVQPRVLASFRNRSASSLLLKMQLLRWNNAKPTPGPDTRPASSMVTGAGCRGENPRLRRREKNVLDIPSYRTALVLIDEARTILSCSEAEIDEGYFGGSGIRNGKNWRGKLKGP